MALSVCEELILLENVYLRNQYLKKKKCTVQKVYKVRSTLGEYHHLHKTLCEDEERFFEYYRMSPATFGYILNSVQHIIKKGPTNFHETIEAEERLVVTLRFLATGSSYRSLSFSFRMSHATISLIVRDVCQAIWKSLLAEHLAPPSEEELKINAEQFYRKWGFPNCIGAIDGKHIRVKAPPKSGSMYYNYKHYFSFVLQAVADPNYRFVCIEVGAFGKQSDGGVFDASRLHFLIENGDFNVPSPAVLPGTDCEAPYVLVGDEAYPLKHYLLRPFPRNSLSPENILFNERLSRARNTIECGFGLLSSKWRILTKAIETKVETAKVIAKCVCILHNIVIDKDGLDTPGLLQVQRTRERNQRPTTPNATSSRGLNYAGLTVRNLFRDFLSEKL